MSHPPPLQGAAATEAVDCVFVIPALAESACLFDTLTALCISAAQTQAHVQVIVVVNNRVPSHCTPAELEDNAATLAALARHATADTFAPLPLAWVDASSPGNALPAREGVGLARKLGADHGLRLLWQAKRPDAPIVHLDADSPPAPHYCRALLDFYTTVTRAGGYAAYAHSIDAPSTPAGRTMIAYEIYMRCHELGLRYAGSPYAYPALGSIMSSTAHAYAAAGGMNRRCAGEDFYFMQQLVKTGSLEAIPDALVHPSGRSSQRTPFGTGRVVASGDDILLYSPETYTLLKGWLALATANIMDAGVALQQAAAAMHPELARFLDARNFADAWESIAATHHTPARRLHQFHVWFDGLRTIQLIHHLRDVSYSDVAVSDGAPQMLAWYHEAFPSAATADPMILLEQLRRICNR